ncbi:VOC family protein [Psychrobacillus sp. NPDC096426]|uniref:VOC family protein n=1 Tax=Psychrobacillus sp. NPDC096426 TaxID=3364491 RepID=UPI00382D5B84
MKKLELMEESEKENDSPHGTRIQIEVDSIDEAICKAKNNGAMIIRDKMEFDDFYLAYLIDPVGIGFGLIQKINKTLVKSDIQQTGALIKQVEAC